jgi:hypothetical protein
MTTDERLKKVEAQLVRMRWLNRCLAAGIGLSLVLWGLAQTFGPETAQAQSGTKMLQANAFVLQDENDEPRATLAYLPEKGPMLTLMDEKGNARAVLGLKPGGPSLELMSEDHTVRARLAVDNQMVRLVLSDENGKEIWSVPGGVRLIGN